MPPRVAGYLRAHRTCGSLASQEEMIQNWYWAHPERWVWSGMERDKAVKGKSLHLSDRPQLRKLLDRLESGDLIVFTFFGVLCYSIEDALEGLPEIFGRGIRLFSIGDDRELRDTDLRMFRMIQRDWYTVSSPKRPSLLGSGRSPIGRTKVRLREVRFMQYCWRKSTEEGLTLEKIAKAVVSEFPVHPRYEKSPPTVRQCGNAVRVYHHILTSLMIGRQVPSWVRKAISRGYFQETLSKSADLRFNRFIQSF